uniref:Uncharacterized protein n=2 Tax=Timema TaxID=61471 RepID=A0A7R9DUN4_TIMPO|nr:unnamed protein product [Timema poppensis]
MFVKFGKKESELTVYQIYDLDLERLINGLKAQYNERKKEIILKVPSIKKKIAAMRKKQKK